MRLRLTGIFATTLLVLTLAGCSGDDKDQAPAPGAPTALADLVDDTSATATIAVALDALREGNAGTFATHVLYGDLAFDYYGSYRLVPAQQRVSVTADLADGPSATEAVGDGGRYFVRLPPDGPVSSPCWVTGDPQQVAAVSGVETNPDFTRLPGAIHLAATAIGIANTSVSDEVFGSVDLVTAMALVSPRLPALLDLSGDQDRVLARFDLDDGVLAGITVSGPAILAALDLTGTPADREELERVFSADPAIEVTFSDSGADVLIEAPGRGQVIDLSTPGAEERVDTCS